MALHTALSPLLLGLGLLAQSSPWWEQYDSRDSFLCPRIGRVNLERNDSQASLIAGGSRSTAFRQESILPGTRYSNGTMTLVLRGDILSIEQRRDRIDCTRTERV